MPTLIGKISKSWVPLTCGLLIHFSVQAQSIRNLMKAGDKFFDLENYRSAIPFYEQVLNEENENAQALYRAGVSYLAYDKDKASDYLYKAQRLKPNVAPDIEYWLGRVDHVNYRFDDAVEHYQLYAKTLSKHAIARKEITLLINQSRNAQKMVQNPKDLFVRNLGPVVNTPYSDHSPVISKDGKTLLFTTRSQTSPQVQAAIDGEYFEEIVEATRLDADTWSTPRSISLHLNSKGHDASIQLFADDTKLLLYRQTQNGDFYVSEKQGNDWSIPEKLNANINTKEFESDAFMTADGTALYFASNHNSKNGDKDLYVAYKTIKGDWDKPKKLGNNLNTSFNEDSPFLTPDGKTLYFTSQGHNTMGGYDVFVTHLDAITQTWSKPENMGYPINSPDDDTYFRLNHEGTTAYLSSYRMGGYGEKDIWSIDLSKTVLVQGQVLQQNKAALAAIDLTFSSQPTHNKALSYTANTTSDTGKFEIQIQSGRKYQVTFSKNGKILGNQEYEVPATISENVVLQQDFSLSIPKAAIETAVQNK